MCGIAGFSNLAENYMQAKGRWEGVLQNMNRIQKHRGPDGEGTFLGEKCAMGHVRLSILDLKNGHQPMVRYLGGKCYAIVHNGEIYNMKEIKEELIKKGAIFSTSSDTEVILQGFIQWGPGFIKKLNGIFACAIWDDQEQKLYLYRDHLGVKPLFYTVRGDNVVFASEMKGIFQYPNIKPEIDSNSLREVFGLGPAKTYGKGVFKNIEEVLPGHFLVFDKNGKQEHCYWSLKSEPHEDSYETTVEKTAELVENAVKSQMLSDISISTFLSGGVDSSLVTAICAKELKKQGKILDTFSFDFKDNNLYFKENAFQPSRDRPYVDLMIDYAKTNHKYLECGSQEQFDYLQRAVDARDLPCMADVESSMLYFCEKVAPYNKVTLTGECADEIFGGYPWFHKKECFEGNLFPWSMDMKPRTSLLQDQVLDQLQLEEYAQNAYQKTIEETPRLEGENPVEKRRREIAYLNIKWFMVTLLDRTDRTSMSNGLEARVPLADYHILEYVWNVPWEMKTPDGLVKGLLRKAGESHLPHEILYRPKSPYPKTYNPEYELLLQRALKETMESVNAPLFDYIDKAKLKKWMATPKDYGKPFYGQLMAGPQMMAYLLQVNYWLKKYSSM